LSDSPISTSQVVGIIGVSQFTQLFSMWFQSDTYKFIFALFQMLITGHVICPVDGSTLDTGLDLLVHPVLTLVLGRWRDLLA
jgi:hypothetical protein